MKNVRIRDALNSLEVLEQLGNRATSKNMKMYWTVSVVMKDILELQSAFARFKEQLISGYNFKDANKSEPAIPTEKQSEANQKVYDWLDASTELPHVRGRIRFSHFASSGIQITASELALLDWLIIPDVDEDLFESEQ